MSEYANLSRRQLYPKVMEATTKALTIDPDLGEAHISRASTLMFTEWDWKGAEAEYKKGIALLPNYATGHHWYAEMLMFMGRTAEAFSEISIAVALDPISPAIISDKGKFYYYNRQYDEGLDLAHKTLELDPGFVNAHRMLSLNYSGKGNFEQAIHENTLWSEGLKNKVKGEVALAHLYAAGGRADEAAQILAKMEAGKGLTDNDYRGMAIAYAALGDKDKAFQWLEKSFDKHEESLLTLKIDPKLDALRGDDRLEVMLEKVGLK